MLGPDRHLAINHAPTAVRSAMHALFALDDRLGDIVRTTREPLVGQMRLTWWYEALIKLDTDVAPAEPLLQDLAAHVVPHGIAGPDLAAMLDGWEALIIADPLDDAALASHADARGAGLFAVAGRLLGGDSPLLAPAGRGWAYADLAAHLSAPQVAQRAAALADEPFSAAFSTRWPARLRPIGVLSLLARMDALPGSPVRKALRVTRFRLTGR